MREYSNKTDSIDEDECLILIEQGMTQTKIAQRLGIDQAQYNRWLYSDRHRLIRARDAMTRAAQAYADKAIDELEAANDAVSVTKANNLAHHLRWMASRYNRALFGDKIEVNQDTTITIQLVQYDSSGLPIVQDVSQDKHALTYEHKQGLMNGEVGGVLAAGGDGSEGNPTSTASHSVSSVSSHDVLKDAVERMEWSAKDRERRKAEKKAGGSAKVVESIEKDTKS
jgi:transcriptional regulator with XRE-family HTH domain